MEVLVCTFNQEKGSSMFVKLQTLRRFVSSSINEDPRRNGHNTVSIIIPWMLVACYWAGWVVSRVSAR